MTKRAFLFPGQGAQYAGMGKDLAENFPAAKHVFERASDRLGFDLSQVCFAGSDDDLVRTDIQQPAILTHSIAALEALREARGDAALTAEATCGLSLGEYSALVFAGVLSLEDGVYLVRKRGEFMQQACEEFPSTLAAVLKVSREDLQTICDQAATETGEYCGLGNILSAVNVTISGGKKAIERAVELIKAQKGRAVPLEVAGAFHSPYMKSAEERLAAEIENTTFNPPRIPVICNVDAKPTTDVSALRQNLVQQLTRSVQWADSMTYLLGNGFSEFVECGPGAALTGVLKRDAKDATLINIDKAKDLALAAGS